MLNLTRELKLNLKGFFNRLSDCGISNDGCFQAPKTSLINAWVSMKINRWNLTFSVGVLMVLSVYSGCAPIPHTICVRDSIEIDFPGEKSQYSQLLITHEYSDTLCLQPDTIIDAHVEKSITVPPLFERKFWLALVPNDPVSGFRICFKSQDSVYFGGHFFHGGYDSKTTYISCDLMGEKIPPHSPQFQEKQICNKVARKNE